MATVAVFPSVLGVRAGIFDFADRLRSAGHDVRIIDYADSRVFADYASAMAEADQHDWKQVMAHALTLTQDDVPTGLVVAGFSMGAGIAEHVGLQMQARAAILVGGIAPTSVFGEGITWPQSCPVQLHRKESDKFLSDAEAAEAVASLRAAGATVEDLVYPGEGHLFNDRDLPDEHDPEATDLMMERVIDFLETVD